MMQSIAAKINDGTNIIDGFAPKTLLWYKNNKKP